VDEYLAANPDVVAAPPVEVPGLTVTPSHGGQKVWKWNAEKGELE
jgi:hypothetical protein